MPMMKEEMKYDKKYGNIPSDKEEILRLLESQLRPKDYEDMQKKIEMIENIPWHEMRFILYLVPKSTPRPRYSSKTGTFYVKNAAHNKKMLEKHIFAEKIIYTRTEFYVDAYLPTPKCSKVDTLLAEKGYIRPISDPDWDNIGKTYSDMIQGILITNDNIISDGVTRKYYSIKPRVEITIRWQEGFESRFLEKRVMHSKIYQSYFSIEEK